MENVLLVLKNCHTEYCFDFTISFAELMAIIGAVIGFGVALYQYYRAQKWKKTEFLLSFISQYREMMRGFNTRRGSMMIDWNRIDIPLEEGEIEGKTKFWFTDELLRKALRIHLNMSESDGFTDEETIIRFAIDEFLEKLGTFYLYLRDGNMKKEDVPGDIVYWINIIGNPNNESKDEPTRKALWEYVISYQFTEVESLCSVFGYKIR
jgi:hypothetical protein